MITQEQIQEFHQFAREETRIMMPGKRIMALGVALILTAFFEFFLFPQTSKAFFEFFVWSWTTFLTLDQIYTLEFLLPIFLRALFYPLFFYSIVNIFGKREKIAQKILCNLSLNYELRVAIIPLATAIILVLNSETLLAIPIVCFFISRFLAIISRWTSKSLIILAYFYFWLSMSFIFYIHLLFQPQNGKYNIHQLIASYEEAQIIAYILLLILGIATIITGYLIQKQKPEYPPIDLERTIKIQNIFQKIFIILWQNTISMGLTILLLFPILMHVFSWLHGSLFAKWYWKFAIVYNFYIIFALVYNYILWAIKKYSIPNDYDSTTINNFFNLSRFTAPFFNPVFLILPLLMTNNIGPAISLLLIFFGTNRLPGGIYSPPIIFFFGISYIAIGLATICCLNNAWIPDLLWHMVLYGQIIILGLGEITLGLLLKHQAQRIDIP